MLLALETVQTLSDSISNFLHTSGADVTTLRYPGLPPVPLGTHIF